MNEFIKMDKSLLNETDDLWVFQEFADYLEGLIGDTYYITTNVEKLEGVPLSAKNILYAWHFYCDVSSSASIYDYLFNNDSITDEHLLSILNSIRDIKFTDLAKRYESGMKIALKNCNFTRFHNPDNYTKLSIDDRYNNFNLIDSGLSKLLSEHFPTYVANYIREKKEELFV